MKINSLLHPVIVVTAGLVIVNVSMFFAFMGLLGINYEGSESSGVYIAYLATLFILTMFFYAFSLVKRGLVKGELGALGIMLFFVVVHFLWVLFDPLHTKLVPEFMVHSFVLGFVGLFSALVIIKYGLLERLIKFAELLFILQSFGIISYSVLNTLSGNKIASLAGATYQALSYYSAFTMGMLLVYNFILPSTLRYNFTSNIVYRFFSYALIFLCVLGVFVGGGRGAFLLMLSYFGFSAYYLVKNDSRVTRKTIVKIVTSAVAIVAMVIVFISFFGQQDFVQSGFKRATAFITNEGIDLERGSSGRDRVYSDAINYIAEQPILGYGPFGIRDKTIHAHNFFLELWLQFGVSILFAFLFFSLYLFSRYKTLKFGYKVWGLFLSLYALVEIQFSSSYVSASHLWFFIGLLLLNKNNLIKSR